MDETHVGVSGKVIILLGPPGAGKGTQAAQLSNVLRIPAISTGEMLRRECQSGSSLGKAVQDVLRSGQLVSDELMNEVVSRRLSAADCRSGCILDGFPRTVSQARYLDSLLDQLNLSGPAVLDFYLPYEDVLSRLSRRRQCGVCGAIFSMNGSSSSGNDLVCPRDGSVLIQRSDDHPAAIRDRLALYERNVRKLVRYYRNGEYHRVSAVGSTSEICDELLHVLGTEWSHSLDLPRIIPSQAHA